MSQTTITLDAGELAFDPAVHPERYEGVRTRRIFAFLIDAAVILFLMLVATHRHRRARHLHARPRLAAVSRSSGRSWRSSTPC